MLEAMAEPSPEGERALDRHRALSWRGGGQGINWQTWRSMPGAQRGSVGRGSGACPWR